MVALRRRDLGFDCFATADSERSEDPVCDSFKLPVLDFFLTIFGRGGAGGG